MVEPGGVTSPGLLGYLKGVLGNQKTTFQTSLNAYKVFADEIGVVADLPVNPSGRFAFSAGKTNSRQYLLRFPVSGGSPLIIFQYAVDACWEQPTGDPHNLSNFPQTANQPES